MHQNFFRSYSSFDCVLPSVCMWAMCVNVCDAPEEVILSGSNEVNQEEEWDCSKKIVFLQRFLPASLQHRGEGSRCVCISGVVVPEGLCMYSHKTFFWGPNNNLKVQSLLQASLFNHVISR